MSALTIVITKPQISDYLQLCYDAIKPVFDNVEYWIDNYISKEIFRFSGVLKTDPEKLIIPHVELYEKPSDYKGAIAVHMDPHGFRVFDLLNEIKSKYVIILDSDFICKDPNFWDKAITLLQEKPMVTISDTGFRYRKRIIDTPFIHFRGFAFEDFPTTPFMGFRREDMLELVPDRIAWGHFHDIFPNTKDPVFDNMKFVSYNLCRNELVGFVDIWGPLRERSFNFFHFWDSRNEIEDDMKIINNKELDESYRIMHLSYAICKIVLKYMTGKADIHKASTLVSEMRKIKNWLLRQENMPYTLVNPYSIVYDLFKNLPFQIEKEEYFDRLRNMREIFDLYRISPELEKEL